MALKDVPCQDCKMPVIKATTEKGLPVVAEIDPVLGGKWKITERANGSHHAQAPTAKFAFGVKLYPSHVCTGWRKK